MPEGFSLGEQSLSATVNECNQFDINVVLHEWDSNRIVASSQPVRADLPRCYWLCHVGEDISQWPRPEQVDLFSPDHYSIVSMFYIEDDEPNCTSIDASLSDEGLNYVQVDQRYRSLENQEKRSFVRSFEQFITSNRKLFQLIDASV